MKGALLWERKRINYCTGAEEIKSVVQTVAAICGPLSNFYSP